MCPLRRPSVDTFDKTPRGSHCPQLSPLQQGKDNPIHLPPKEIKDPGLLPFILLPKTPPLQSPLTNEIVHQPFSLVGLKAVYLKRTENKRGDIKEFG